MSIRPTTGLPAVMDTAEQFARFISLPICADLNEQEQRELFGCFDLVRLPSNTFIESKTGLWLVLDGSVQIECRNEQPTKRQRGELFGLRSFLQLPGNELSWRAIEPCVLLYLNRNGFEKMRFDEPRASAINLLLRVLLRQLSNLIGEIESSNRNFRQLFFGPRYA